MEGGGWMMDDEYDEWTDTVHDSCVIVFCQWRLHPSSSSWKASRRPAGLSPLQGDLTIQDLENCGILRAFNPKKAAQDLISENKAGWSPVAGLRNTDNLARFFDLYTRGKGKPYTMRVKLVDTQTYEATLTTCLSDTVYSGRGQSEYAARQVAAYHWLQDPDVRDIFRLLPPKQAYIRSKSEVHGPEKKHCKSFGASPELISEVCNKRMGEVLAEFHELGYRLDIWDGKC